MKTKLWHITKFGTLERSNDKYLTKSQNNYQSEEHITTSHFARVLIILLFDILVVLDRVLSVHHHGDRDEDQGQHRVESQRYTQEGDTQYSGDH